MKKELLVGERVTLVVRVQAKIGIDTRVTSCIAHDGSGVNSQELVNRHGCSIDREIMPDLKLVIA